MLDPILAHDHTTGAQARRVLSARERTFLLILIEYIGLGRIPVPVSRNLFVKKMGLSYGRIGYIISNLKNEGIINTWCPAYVKVNSDGSKRIMKKTYFRVEKKALDLLEGKDAP